MRDGHQHPRATMVDSNVGKNPEGTASFTVCTSILFEMVLINSPSVMDYILLSMGEMKGDHSSSGFRNPA